MSNPRSWTDLVGESVHTSDDSDIGEIEGVSNSFVVIKRGLLNVHRYYVPLKKVEGWDNKVVWLNSTEEEVRQKYERDEKPSPNTYYLRENPIYEAASIPKVPTLAKRYSEHYSALESSTDNVSANAGTNNQSKTYRCPLCSLTFANGYELSKHASDQH